MNMKLDEEGVSPVIGVVLMVAITVVLAAVVFYVVTSLSDDAPTAAPSVTFHKDGDKLVVVSGPVGLEWAEFDVTGCASVPTGAFEAGDKAEGCSGDVVVRHVPSNSLVYAAEF